MNNMNVAPNVIHSEGDAYVSKDSEDNRIRSPRASIVSLNPDDGSRPLGEGFTPGPFDVICARGKVARDHTGNRRFRLAIDMNLERYRKANSKLCRSLVVSDIVDSIRSASPNGGFVRCDEGTWLEVGDHIAREKVGQCLRDRLHTMYKSSSRAKSARRKSELSINADEVDPKPNEVGSSVETATKPRKKKDSKKTKRESQVKSKKKKTISKRTSSNVKQQDNNDQGMQEETASSSLKLLSQQLQQFQNPQPMMNMASNLDTSNWPIQVSGLSSIGVQQGAGAPTSSGLSIQQATWLSQQQNLLFPENKLSNGHRFSLGL